VAGAWLSLVIPAHYACKQGLREQLRERGRPGRASAVGFPSARQRLTIDAFLLTLGGLAYWQLRQTGTFVREVDGLRGVAVDPVLLLGPSLFLLALGLVFLRIFPLLLRALGWLAQKASNLVVPLGIMRLARHFGRASQVALLIALTTALVFFATVFRDSIVQRQQEIAHYVAGADVRVELPKREKEAVAQAATLEALTGVTAAAHTFRNQARWSPFRVASVNTRPVAFLAVERGRFAQVARYPPGVGRAQMSGLMAALAESGSGAVPLLVSSDAPPGNLPIGSTVQYYLGTQVCDFEIRAIVDQFPTLRTPFVVADLSALVARVDLDDLSLTSAGGRELWLDVDAEQHRTLPGTLEQQIVDESDAGRFRSGRIAADVDTQLRAFRADLIARVTMAAFGLNAVVLVVLSAASFLLVQVFAARRRLVEFGVLRAMGLTGRQLLGLLSLEASLVLALGVGSGTAVGYGLAQVMRPFVSLTLASSLGERAMDRLVIGWATLGPAYAVLLGVYVLALLLLLGALERSSVHRTLRLGDE
jgi:putative ABC transport system permease protein